MGRAVLAEMEVKVEKVELLAETVALRVERPIQ